MDTIPITFTGVQVTALLEQYLRWLDNPGDELAAHAIELLDFDFSQLKSLRIGRFVVGARSRLMDAWSGQFLSANPGAVVLDLGSGIDRRIERVNPTPDQHWYDVDLPDVIAIAEQLYPQRRGHTAVGADVTGPGWLAGIPTDKPAVVVADGLFNLLDESDVQQVLQRIVGHFPYGEVYFNITGSIVAKQRERRPVPLFTRYGITENWYLDDPRAVERFAPTLHLAQAQSQLAASFVRRSPLYYRMLCAALRAAPSLRNSGSVLRYRFGR